MSLLRQKEKKKSSSRCADTSGDEECVLADSGHPSSSLFSSFLNPHCIPAHNSIATHLHLYTTSSFFDSANSS